ncbi:DUF1643 domain-containing protein [Mycobacterium intracellulare]|uniref:DUF1643 domain-containing protein n=1 Tax=Mycobacterium intracellulare TaxID=1767 RepID=UPI001CDA0DA1|nr:DUF1643 domain-containing protein [Mycobacterium intracellulare]MCA2247576.1 DUF1643 domain-containing protein [Mycobacterium intracellulare]
MSTLAQLHRRRAHVSWDVISPCQRYRYRAVRVWDSSLPTLGVVGHRIVTGGLRRCDTDLRRISVFARAWGYGGVDLGHLYGLAAANFEVAGSRIDQIGADNDTHLAAVCQDNDLTVLAWGHDADPARAHEVAELLWRVTAGHGGSLAVLGWDESGQPCTAQEVPRATTPECLTLSATSHGLHEAEDPRWMHLLAGAA